jgi:hypothetical protein
LLASICSSLVRYIPTVIGSFFPTLYGRELPTPTAFLAFSSFRRSGSEKSKVYSGENLKYLPLFPEILPLKNLPIGNEQAGRKINHYFSRRSSMVLSVEACHGEKAGKRNVFYRAG